MFQLKYFNDGDGNGSIVMKESIRNLLKRVFSALNEDSVLSGKQQNDLQLLANWQQAKNNALNPLNKFGMKYFSQNDEDGITLEILRRIQLKTGVFAEFGVGNGSENNTLILLANGWRGFWVGGESLFFDDDQDKNRFCFFKRWIDIDNILISVNEGMNSICATDIDVLSLDLDGNDIYLIQELLESRINPKLFIVEYNAKFPPPIQWKIEYDKAHVWGGDDYYGASLGSFNTLFNRHGYTLVCCNISGVNAFFVRDDLLDYFKDIPRDINELFFAPQYYLFQSYGHSPSPKTIQQFFKTTQHS